MLSSVGRIIKTARRQRDLRLPADCAFGDSLTDHALDAIQLHARDDRTDVDCFVQRKADAQSAHAVPDLRDQVLSNTFLHQQARTRAAYLPLIEPDSIDQSLDGAIEISIVEDDERRFSSQLKRQTLRSRGCGAANRSADFGGTGEGNLVHVVDV